MNDFDIPIFKKTYDLYKTFYSYRNLIPKGDKYTVWQRAENALLDILEGILLASQSYKEKKLLVLEGVSLKLNLLRVFLRLMKEVKTLDPKKYLVLQEIIDEIGRQLGGWIKLAKSQ